MLPICGVPMIEWVVSHLADHGVQEVGPVRINSTLEMLEDALMLVQQAHCEAGHNREETSLSTTEFKKALSFLQRTFEENFATRHASEAD